MEKVLILDANQRSALAATRSLGRRGIHVVAADDSEETLSGASKYCSETFVYPPPSDCSQEFIQILRRECLERNVRMVYPMTEISTYLLLKHRDMFDKSSIPCGSLEAFETLSDKWKLFQIAQRLHIATPKTLFVERREDLISLESSVRFPIVLKPHRSGLFHEGQWVSGSVKYVESFEELRVVCSNSSYFKAHPFLLQEYIEGEGRGVFSLCDHGMSSAFFAHRRLREKPPSGGVSVLSESIEVNPRLREICQTLLSAVVWHGVSMLEFKVRPDGAPYLLEVNARPWGSMQLAIDAGVDFPWLLYQLTTEKQCTRVNGYRIGIRNRWLLGDLDHLYLAIFKDRSRLSKSEKLQLVLRFLKLFERNTHYEVNRWDDLKPFIFEFKRYVRDFVA
jgi:predicted ATP-grasp superfamily ATP-dependent carboligase